MEDDTLFAIRLEITADDIAKGSPFNACLCPVARAINRVLMSYLFSAVCSRVSLYSHYINAGRTVFYCLPNPLPDIVYKFINDFDRDKSVQPFSFDIFIRKDFLKPSILL